MADAEVEKPEAGSTIGDALNAAFDTVEKATPTPTPPPSVKAEAEKPEPAAEVEADAAEVAEPEGESAAAEVKEPVTKSPLESLPFSAEEKATLAKLPPEAQTFLADRYKAMQEDYTKKTTAISALKRDFEPVEELFKPYRDLMRQRNLTPQTAIAGWMNVERALAEGKGSEVIKALIDGYRIDRGKIAAILGVVGAPASTDAPPEVKPNGNYAELSPEMRAKIDALEAKAVARDRDEYNNRARTVSNSIQTFMTAKDDKGNLSHPYFADVENDMAELYAVASRQGQNPSLDALYERAVWANPQIRAKVLTAQKQQEQALAAEEARKKAAAARKAASPVTGSPGAGKAPDTRTPKRSLRDEIEANAAEVFSAQR